MVLNCLQDENNCQNNKKSYIWIENKKKFSISSNPSLCKFRIIWRFLTLKLVLVVFSKEPNIQDQIKAKKTRCLRITWKQFAVTWLKPHLLRQIWLVHFVLWNFTPTLVFKTTWTRIIAEKTKKFQQRQLSGNIYQKQLSVYNCKHVWRKTMRNTNWFNEKQRGTFIKWQPWT